MSPQPYRLGGGDESEFNLLGPQHDHHVPVNVPMRIMRKPVANFESTADTFPVNDIKRPPAVVETARPHRSRWTETLSRWTWEICSLTLAAAALVAIIIILRVYDGESLHKWKVGISVNTVIAILSTIFKGLLAMPISTGLSQLKWISFSRTAQRAVNLEIYDGASRGAWGSFLLLVKQFSGRRLPAVANLGALIALIILVVDPFSQASASIGFCDRVSPSQAVLRRHNNYTWYQHDGAAQGELSTTMQFAILKGFYAPPMNSSQSMANFVQCPTGNCTFPTQENVSFSTLTMCHSCKDISSSIVRYDTGTKFEPRGYALDGYPYNLTLPGQGAELSSSIFNITSSDGFPGGHAKEQYPEDSWNRTNLFDFQGMAVVSSNSSCKYPSNCKFEPFAFDCSFRPCIKTFSANVTNGIYTEEERSREYLHYIDAPWYYFQKAVNRTFINGTWMDCTSQKTPSGTHTAQVILSEVQYLDPSSLSSLDALPSVWYQPECVYYIGQGSTLSLSEYMAHQIIKDELFKFSFIEIYDPGVVKGVAWMKELWNGGNMSIASVDSFVDKIALSIGAEMRGNGDEAYYEYQGGNISERLTRAWGDVHHTEPCIRAYWKYLSFLAVLFAAELVFFISVIAIDYRSTLWQEGWKTSTLPLLVPGLHAHNMTDELRSLGGYSEIGEDHVKLVKTDGDWKLIKSPAG